MGHDLYSSLSGAFGTLHRLEVVANNLANVNTTGFKRQRVAFEAMGPQDSFARIADGLYDQSDGGLEPTGDPVHVALRGPGWLMVGVTDDLGPLLTRDGALQVNPNSGVLEHPTGRAVLGQEGPIVVPPGQTVRIDEDGQVIGSVDGVLGTLRIVTAVAEPAGTNLWRATSPLTEAAPNLVPAHLERSNVQPTVAMVELVEASRTFEMVQNVMKASDELDGRLNAFGGGR